MYVRTKERMYDIRKLEDSVGRDHVCAFVNQLPVVTSADYTTEREMDCWLRHIERTVPHLHPERYLEDSEEVRNSKEKIAAVVTLPMPPEMVSLNSEHIKTDTLAERWQ